MYVHDNPGWPSLAWDEAALADARAAVRQKHGRLFGRMEALGFDLRSEASLLTLTSDVVKSSAIEGENLNPDDVRSSIARKLGLDAGGLPKSGRNVDGVVAMMLDATRNFTTPLTKERLFGWHASLFGKRTAGGRIKVGQWRTGESGPMQVVSGAMGKETVHFEAPNAARVEAEMSRFFEWYNGQSSTDPMFKAGVAHFWFVTIHPFGDGNGRIARAIADLALARADETKDRFYSMSAQIEAERKDYYRELEAAQRGSLDITRWLMWFLGCLERALDAAEQALASVLYKARFWLWLNERPVNERQRVVINRMLSGFEGLLTSSKYATLAKCSPDSALRDIQELLARGILLRNPGGGRSTSYRLASLDGVRRG